MNEKTEIVTTGTNALTPAQMILQAVNSSADLDKVKGLMELQVAWEANEARKAYHAAMSEFKKTPIEIEKDKPVSYGNTSYKHATLGNIVRKITGELSKHGLSATWKNDQTTDGKTITVTCRITHVLGHTEETKLSGSPDTSGAKNPIQALGSAITYLQRYTLLSALGLATADQDDDAKSVDDFLNAWQIEDLRKELKEKALTEAKLLEYMGVEKLEDVKAKDFNKAMNAIKSAKKKQ